MVTNLIVQPRIASAVPHLDFCRRATGKKIIQPHAPASCWWIPMDMNFVRDERFQSFITLAALVAGLKRDK